MGAAACSAERGGRAAPEIPAPPRPTFTILRARSTLLSATVRLAAFQDSTTPPAKTAMLSASVQRLKSTLTAVFMNTTPPPLEALRAQQDSA